MVDQKDNGKTDLPKQANDETQATLQTPDTLSSPDRKLSPSHDVLVGSDLAPVKFVRIHDGESNQLRQAVNGGS